MNEGQTIIVTGAASGIGAQTVDALKANGARVIGVDINETDACDAFIRADLSDPSSIAELVDELPSGADGLANIAGLPPTSAAELVIKVNLLGLREFTNALVPKLADGASIVNLASLAGFGWPQAVEQSKARAGPEPGWGCHGILQGTRPRCARVAGPISCQRKPWSSGPCKTAGPGETAASA